MYQVIPIAAMRLQQFFLRIIDLLQSYP